MQDIMVDIETLGTTPGSVVLSIGAIMFDPEAGLLGPTFYEEINQQSCFDIGCTTDASTILWWNRQSADARAVLDSTVAKPIQDVLHLFSSFVESTHSKSVRIWGNGSDFDNVLIISLYNKCNRIPNWKYYNHRCFRTLKNLFPGVPKGENTGKHNALNDAIAQADHACAIFKKMRNR